MLELQFERGNFYRISFCENLIKVNPQLQRGVSHTPSKSSNLLKKYRKKKCHIPTIFPFKQKSTIKIAELWCYTWQKKLPHQTQYGDWVYYRTEICINQWKTFVTFATDSRQYAAAIDGKWHQFWAQFWAADMIGAPPLAAVQPIHNTVIVTFMKTEAEPVFYFEKTIFWMNRNFTNRNNGFVTKLSW